MNAAAKLLANAANGVKKAAANAAAKGNSGAAKAAANLTAAAVNVSANQAANELSKLSIGSSNVNASPPSTSTTGGGKSRKALKGRKGKKTPKAKGKGKKTRKLSPALKKWNDRVMEVFRREKKKNPAYKLGDAMKQAKKEQ